MVIINNAPVLVPASPFLGATFEDTPITIALTSFINTPSGTTITDADSANPVGGVAITGVIGNGTWEYSLDNGVSFVAIDSSTSDTSAVLLPADAVLRYTPDAANGEVASINYCAWDTTFGNSGDKVDLSQNGVGGTTAFSETTDTASILVSDVNDAPVLTPANPILGVTKQSEPLQVNLADFINNGSGTTTITDVDNGAVVGGIAVVGITGTGYLGVLARRHDVPSDIRQSAKHRRYCYRQPPNCVIHRAALLTTKRLRLPIELGIQHPARTGIWSI